MYCQRRRGAAPAHFHLSFTPVSLWEHHERRAPSGARGICPPARAWIVEDDYDSEFRHSGEPIPAMLGMVPDAPVVYLGTFSKTLFPALRIGFMVMPPALADAAQDAIGALLRGDTVLNSGRWPALSRRDTMRAIWQRCAACTVNVSNSCARRWRKR